MNYEKEVDSLAIASSALVDKTSAGENDTLKPHLLFESRGALWGVAAEAVCEVLLLPEIAPLDGAPWWVGVLDIRGRIIPVIELGELAGAAPRCFETTDSIIIVDSLHGQLGLIVEAVRDVRSLPEDEHEGTSTNTVSGLTRVDGEIVRLLNLPFVARFAARETSPPEPSPARPFCPDASPGDRALFFQRARALQADIAQEDDVVSPTLVAVRVGGEILGLDMEWVREFAQRPAVTPVPGGPSDLLGLVNLRGEVIPLLDLRPTLGLPVTDDAGTRIAFVACEGAQFGVAVEEVLSVFAPREDEYLVPPAAPGTNGDMVRAAVFYEGETMAVLDLHSLLHQGGWITHEEMGL